MISSQSKQKSFDKINRSKQCVDWWPAPLYSSQPSAPVFLALPKDSLFVRGEQNRRQRNVLGWSKTLSTAGVLDDDEVDVDDDDVVDDDDDEDDDDDDEDDDDEDELDMVSQAGMEM